jgi:hypothetical protein
MIRIEQTLNIERDKLNMLIEQNDEGLFDGRILKQSRKVDKIIAEFQKLDLNIIAK